MSASFSSGSKFLANILLVTGEEQMLIQGKESRFHHVPKISGGNKHFNQC